jgi:son of sevenless-like protein
MLPTDKRLINFSKRIKIMKVIRALLQYQSVQYHFQPVVEFQHWLDHKLQNARQIIELYYLSTELEPREQQQTGLFLNEDSAALRD